MYAVSLIYSNLSPYFSLFHSFKAMLSFSKDNGLFCRYHRRQLSFPLNLSIYLSPMSVTIRQDWYYHRQFNPKTSYFHQLVGGRVATVHEEASPNENKERTAIHQRSLVSRGWLARGSVPQMLRYIYTLPKTSLDQGMLNRYFPSQETPRC